MLALLKLKEYTCIGRLHRFDDVEATDGDVLDACTAVVLYILFNLTDSFPWGWLVDGHLDGPFPISDHY